MSLDIYISLKKGEIAKRGTGIFARENGKMRELSLNEAKDRYPDANVKEHVEITNELWHGNITHNLGKMAKEVCEEEYFYKILWHPDKLEFDPRLNLGHLLSMLMDGLSKLKSDPDKFKAYNPENGWGDYEGLVNFVEDYANALEDALEKFNENNIEIEVWV